MYGGEKEADRLPLSNAHTAWQNQYAELCRAPTAQVSYRSQRQVVCGAAKCRVLQGSPGISVSEGWQLEQKVELQSEFIGARPAGCTLLWGEREGGGVGWGRTMGQASNAAQCITR